MDKESASEKAMRLSMTVEQKALPVAFELNIRPANETLSLFTSLHMSKTPDVQIRLHNSDSGDYYVVKIDGLTMFDLPEKIVFAFRDYYLVEIQNHRQLNG